MKVTKGEIRYLTLNGKPVTSREFTQLTLDAYNKQVIERSSKLADEIESEINTILRILRLNGYPTNGDQKYNPWAKYRVRRSKPKIEYDQRGVVSYRVSFRVESSVHKGYSLWDMYDRGANFRASRKMSFYLTSPSSSIDANGREAKGGITISSTQFLYRFYKTRRGGYERKQFVALPAGTRVSMRRHDLYGRIVRSLNRRNPSFKDRYDSSGEGYSSYTTKPGFTFIIRKGER